MKFQIPSTKLQRSTKFKIPKEAVCLERRTLIRRVWNVSSLEADENSAGWRESIFEVVRIAAALRPGFHEIAESEFGGVRSSRVL